MSTFHFHMKQVHPGAQEATVEAESVAPDTKKPKAE